MEYFDNLLRPGSKSGVKEDVSGRTESFRVNQGYFFVGVSDAEGNECWGLHPQSGRLYRMHADVSSEQISLRPPPAGYPDGAMTQVMFDDKGRPAHLAGRVEGTMIDTIVDSENRLTFRVNGGPLLPASGFLSSTRMIASSWRSGAACFEVYDEPRAPMTSSRLVCAWPQDHEDTLRHSFLTSS